MLWQPVPLSLPSWSYLFSPVLRTIFFPSHWLLSRITTVKTMDVSERGMNHVAMSIIIPRKEYWSSYQSSQQAAALKPCMLSKVPQGLGGNSRENAPLPAVSLSSTMFSIAFSSRLFHSLVAWLVVLGFNAT